jgi:pilus assembly protein CpaC
MKLGKYFSLCFLALYSGLIIAASPIKLNMHKGEVAVLNVSDIEQIAIGDEEVAQVRPMENGEMVIIAVTAGETYLHVWRRGGRQATYNVYVTNDNMSRDLKVARTILKEFPDIKVRELEQRLYFAGEVNKSDSEAVFAMIGQFNNSVNMVKVREFDIKPVVRLDVKIVEMRKRATTQLGIRWQQVISGPTFGIHKSFKTNDNFALATDDPYDDSVVDAILSSIPMGDKGFYGYSGITSVLTSRIELLAENGDARIVASPKLSAKSGEEATFHVGGQFPIPVVDEFGRPSVEFKDYGVVLEIKPIVDRNSAINTRVKSELSSIDFATQVNDIPGVTTRKTDTVVNLNNGDTLVISGLALVETSNSVSKLPGLGDIPLVGGLFRSTDKNVDSKELVIFVTPYIVDAKSNKNQKVLSVGKSMLDAWKDFDINKALME